MGGFGLLPNAFPRGVMAMVSDRLAPTSMADDHSGIFK